MALADISRKLRALTNILAEGDFVEQFRLLCLVGIKNIREQRIKRFIKRLHGPKDLEVEAKDVVVLCLFRDGMSFLPHFLDYHRKLGVSHFVFVDNRSEDGSTAFLKEQDDATVFYSDLPFGKYKGPFKKFLSETYGRNNWGLLLDIDECFDYPMSSEVSLHQFIKYLDTAGYNAVVANLLDRFSNQPILEVTDDNEDLSITYPYYDLSHLRKEGYSIMFGDTNDLADDQICTFSGGVRYKFFKDEGILTKHPLFRLDPGMGCTSNGHDIRFAKVADVTTVLYHYKYNQDFKKVLKRALDEKGYYGGAGGYKFVEEELAKNPKLSLYTEEARELRGIDELIDQGFVLMSAPYRNWVAQRNTQKHASHPEPVLASVGS